MSTTPKTDAFAAVPKGLGTGYYQALDFARDLETALAASEAQCAVMREALSEALPALKMLENQFASSLSSDSRSHDEDRPWRKRVNRLIQFAKQPASNDAGSALLERCRKMEGALKTAKAAMLNHAGWTLNHSPDGKELPMSRPEDVQEAEAMIDAALSSPSAEAINPQKP